MVIPVSESVKRTLDAAAGGAVIMAWLDITSVVLTIIATLFTIIWTGMRIYQSWKEKKNAASPDA